MHTTSDTIFWHRIEYSLATLALVKKSNSQLKTSIKVSRYERARKTVSEDVAEVVCIFVWGHLCLWTDVY